ncbi:MAG: tetratricopeptide repeat protein [Flavobacteriales bacterium]|nr:tetratricopeptide repeat protein [Flavobacteriales bacterium]
MDSLRSVLRHAPADSTRFKCLIALAGEYIGSDPDTTFAICLSARGVAAKTGRPGDVGEVEGWLGYLEEQRGNIPQALDHYSSSLNEAERLRDSAGISVVLNNLAAIYKDQGRIEEAMDAHQRSLHIRRARRDSSGIATSLNNLGLILYDQGRIPEAMEHYSDALRIYEAIGDQEGTATALHNIAGVYRDQGDLPEALAYFQRALLIHKALGDTYAEAGTEDNVGGVLEGQARDDEALAHYRRAFTLHEQVGDQRGMGYSLRNIAGLELKAGAPDTALMHARRALAFFTSSDDKRGRASALWMTGKALQLSGRGGEAERTALEALELARELGYPQLVRDASGLLDKLYRDQGRWREAIEMHDLYTIMRDSVLNQDARRSAIRQQYKYAYEKKEAALKAEQVERDLLGAMAVQKERNRRNVLLLVGVGILMVAVGLLSRVRHLRRTRSEIQQERDVSENLLHNILPEEVAAELKQKGAAEARLIEHVTVLFTDFKGFTAVSEKLSPKDLVRDIHECFSAFDHIMAKHGIEKIKTIGDAYMAAGGLPTPNNTHAHDVVMAALEIRDFIAEGKARKVAAGLPCFEIRIGIHTGPVVAGIVGVKKFAYDIWGDTVNTASRMESSGEVGQVNISESTYVLLKDVPDFHFTPRGKVQAKGKGEMEMYFVQRA